MPTDPEPLVAEGMRRSDVVWLAVDARPPRLVWHVWHESADYVLTGGGEQEVPGLVDGGTVEVVVRSKDKGSRLATWAATAARVAPDGEEWRAMLPRLLAARLNPPDGGAAAERWARSSVLWRLTPVTAAGR